MTSWYRHVYLSPHYDDAALSCGGLIHQQTQAGQLALVVTVCAAPPDSNAPLSPFAEEHHQVWGSPRDVAAFRQGEDQTAMEILGADYLRLHFTDAIYRGRPQAGEWYYTGREDLFGQIHPAEIPLIADITAAIIETVPHQPDTILYAPLTVGHHVDHQLVHAAARRLRQQGYQVVFYEDYPYADPTFSDRYPHTLEATLATPQADALRPQLRTLSEENLAAKIESIGAYSSQLPMLFGSETEMPPYVRNYARYVGDGQPAERIWL